MNKQFVYINDVGPRDGLQNQANILSVPERVQLINSLVDANIPEIEIGAFVSPKAVPAMAGTDQVFTGIKPQGALYSALVPNLKGFQIAKKTGVQVASLVVCASNTMNEKNIGLGTEDTLQMMKNVIDTARRDNCKTRSPTKIHAYLATAWVCPFEGAIHQESVTELAEKVLAMGIERLVIADTIGAADPGKVYQLMTALAERIDVSKLACHFHDTRAMGLANVYAAATAGIRRFDASIAGLGGCPFAPGASGNVATEDVVLLLEQMGFETGIDMGKLLAASDLAETLTGTAKGGKAKYWLKQNYNNAEVCT